MTYSPGDILLYKESPHNLVDEAIELVTCSQYVHIAIAVSDHQKIEALSGGVIVSPLANTHPASVWSYMATIKDYDRNSLNMAVYWLQSMIGQPYGFADDFNAVLEALNFNMSLDAGNHFDCSSLAAEFLMKAGGVPRLQNVTDPHRVTPGLLERRSRNQAEPRSLAKSC